MGITPFGAGRGRRTRDPRGDVVTMRWIGLITIVGPGALFLARLVRLTHNLSRAPQISHVPPWLIPHLVKILYVVDIGIAVGLGVSSIILLRMGSE